MLLNLFKKEKLHILAPVNGEIIPIEEVPDPIFSQKMMGEGVAIIPSKGDVCSPVEGTIIQIALTKHAIGILAEDGTEILIHIGLETVSLNGEGFGVSVEVGDKVVAGQLLVKVDWAFLSVHAKSIVTPIVITNSQESNKRILVTGGKEGIAGKTVIITASPK